MNVVSYLNPPAALAEIIHIITKNSLYCDALRHAIGEAVLMRGRIMVAAQQDKLSPNCPQNL